MELPKTGLFILEKIKEKKIYAKESPDLLKRFFGRYGVKSDWIAFSDNGNAFYENGESVLKALGFKDHRNYPANVHQFISMNDNPFMGLPRGRGEPLVWITPTMWIAASPSFPF